MNACLQTTPGVEAPLVIPSKECFKCKKVKPLTEFYKHGKMADGHLNKCKECTKKDTVTNREENIDYYRQYDRDRASLPHRVEAREDYALSDRGKEVRRRISRAVYVNHKDKHLERQRESRIVNRGKHRAREAIAYAVLIGELIKPDACQECHTVGLVHGHHCDYNKPLDVMWLCPTCHGKWHRNNKAIEPF